MFHGRIGALDGRLLLAWEPVRVNVQGDLNIGVAQATYLIRPECCLNDEVHPTMPVTLPYDLIGYRPNNTVRLSVRSIYAIL